MCANSLGATQIGFRNRNQQTNIRAIGFPGTDHLQRLYVLKCLLCDNRYGANGSDIHQNKCQVCQGGRPGLHFTEE